MAATFEREAGNLPCLRTACFARSKSLPMHNIEILLFSWNRRPSEPSKPAEISVFSWTLRLSIVSVSLLESENRHEVEYLAVGSGSGCLRVICVTAGYRPPSRTSNVPNCTSR